MRTITLACPALIPRKERHWLSLQDRLRMLWINADRKPFRGLVKVSYLWESPEPPKTLREEADLAIGLIEILEFMVDVEARMFVGSARCEKAEKSKLRITVDEEAR